MRKRFVITEIIVLTIIFGVIFSGIIFGYSKLFVEPNIYNIQFKDINGITKGSPVRFMGINVGYVRRLKSKKKHIDVQILITKKDMKIPNGTLARVEFYGLGGSKSIELMPADEKGNIGILTGENIRLNDIIFEATGLVDVVEGIEKFVKDIDKDSLKNVLDSVANFKAKNISKINNAIENTDKNVDNSTKTIQDKEKDFSERINEINTNMEKRNNVK